MIFILELIVIAGLFKVSRVLGGKLVADIPRLQVVFFRR